MPIPTKTSRKGRSASDRPASAWSARRLIAAGAVYGAAELGIGLLFGFFRLGRAEALLFLAVRPWLLIIAAAMVAGLPLRQRAIFYAAALLLAGTSESIFLAVLGADDPLPEAGRGLVAGAMLAILADGAAQIGRRIVARFGAALAAVALGALLLVPGALRPYEAIVLGAGHRAVAERRDLMLMSALPLMWGDSGPLDPGSRPAAVYAMLEKEFALRPLDVLDEPTLSTGGLLLLAQPRALAPIELVALDSWVRRGGRTLILTDPALFWPSELPLGDIRRPPAIGLLGPLLSHWGLRLDDPEEKKAVARQLQEGPNERRLVMFAPGRFVREQGSCTVEAPGHLARCRIGKGEAMLVADADMMHDRLWVGQGTDGTERHARTSDNPLLVGDWLDRLSGKPRPRAAAPVEWLSKDRGPLAALLLALLPIAAAAAPAGWRAIARRR